MTEATGPGSGPPARILFLTDDFGGGTGNHLLRMIDRWDRDRWRPEVVSFAERTARREPRVRHTRLPSPPGPSVYPVRQIQRFRQVRRLVRGRELDLLHAYFFWPILYGRLLRASGATPVLIENREDEGFAWGFHEYAWLRLTRSVPDRVICVSEAVRETVLERERLDPDRTTVIHNGVEMPDEVPEEEVGSLREELEIPPEAPVVGMVANLNRAVKGVDRFVEAVPALLEQVPEVRCVVVGGGHDEEALRSETRSRGLGDRLLFPGYREDIDRFYGLMDVSVLTSRSEGLSITLLESMAHGLPVVATRVGGNPEVVVDGETGYLVPFDDPDAFVARVAELLDDRARRRRMGQAGLRRVKENFTINGASRQYEDLYRDILASRRGDSGERVSRGDADGGIAEDNP